MVKLMVTNTSLSHPMNQLATATLQLAKQQIEVRTPTHKTTQRKNAEIQKTKENKKKGGKLNSKISRKERKKKKHLSPDT